MVGSCNGVLCLTTSPQSIHYIGRWRQVQVYSLRKNSWNVLSNVPNSLYNIYEPQVVVNGAFYWLVNSVVSDCLSILMFDFTDETFEEIKMPDCFNEDLGEFVRLGEVKGKLSLLLHLDEDSSAGDSLEMWMMEDSGWVRQFVVNVSQLYVPGCLAMNDEVMLLSTYSNVGHILSCDLKTLELTDHEVEEQRPRAFTYTPSLALLGEEN
ncbi:hypothetical protein SLEP1_g59234 [Rubroshorea leprosula]|uniref:F-box associated beta-propeller type 1 domain-containing protein n=1 Tax=Rubroshorea leprosula TaxID=152421 RepID=A0AAV5MRQ1_9ROSI|nr:hypothetical protein SLEP1_g59234 [Rubroshorea leprosula]